MIDRFAGYVDKVDAPATRWFTITPSDSVDLTERPKALRVDGGGTLALMGSDAKVEVFTVFDGETLPVRPARVMLTGTTATGIKALC